MRDPEFLILEEMIAAGWGDTPQSKIPANWREIEPPKKPVGRPRSDPEAREDTNPHSTCENARAPRFRKTLVRRNRLQYSRRSVSMEIERD